MGYDEKTGLPLTDERLDCGLPPFLQASIKTMEESWARMDCGEKDLRWDAYWCDLQSDINYAEVENLISSEQAWYLREKYLRIERE